MTLTDFLFARIAEDEAGAHAATEPFMEGDRTGLGELAVLHPMLIPHIRRWKPARVLAECESKRRLIVRMTAMARAEGDDTYGTASVALTVVLRRLALPYADHPDYRQEWRP